MGLSKHKLTMGVLWFAFIGLVLPVSLLAVNPVTDVSLFNHVFAKIANSCDPDFTVTITSNGFQPQSVTTTVVVTDTVVGGTFRNNAVNPVTVTFPEGMFGPLTRVLDNGEVRTECESDPQGGENVITATVGTTVHRFTVNVITEAISHAVGGEIMSNPFVMMLPAMSLVFLMAMVLYAGRRVRKVHGI